MKFSKRTLLVLFLSASSLIYAQDYRFGLHFSPSIGWISTDDSKFETSPESHFGFGLMADIAFTDNYGLSTGIDIVNRGAEMELDDTTYDYRADYLQIPFTLKMRTREFDYLTYTANFGGAIGFRTKETIGTNPELNLSEDLNFISSFNASFIVGIGVEYSLGGTSAIIASIEYQKSLIDNLSEDDDRIASNRNYRFDTIGLKLGLLF